MNLYAVWQKDGMEPWRVNAYDPSDAISKLRNSKPTRCSIEIVKVELLFSDVIS